MEILRRSNQNPPNPPKSTDPWKSFPGPTKILQKLWIHRNPSQIQPKSSKSTDPWKSFPDPTKILEFLQNPRIHGNPSQVLPKCSKCTKSSKIHGSIEILPRSNQNLQNSPKSTDPWKSLSDPTKIFTILQILQNPQIHGNLSQIQPNSSKSSKIHGSMQILPRSNPNFPNPSNPI